VTLFQTNRRQFLRTTSLATGSAFVPYMLTARTGHTAEANDRLNIAAIGTGNRGSAVGHQAGRLGNIVACADVDRGRAEKFAAEYDGKCDIHTDYRKILDRKDVDAITCGAPDHWHTKIVIDAMEAGKDVYCEKPLTLTIAEGQQIIEAVEKTNRVCQVGTQQRSEYDSKFLKAIVIVQSGRLGEKVHAVCGVGEAQTGGPFPSGSPPANLDWNMWLGQAPEVEYCSKRFGFDFRWWLEYSGGQITDWGVHHTDIALWALGGADTGIVEAEGHGVFPGFPYTVNVIDFLNGRSQLPNQYNVAKSFVCTFKLPNENTIELNSVNNEIIFEGDQGKIRVNRRALTGKPVREIEASESDQAWLAGEVKKLARGLPMGGHMANFFHCIKTRERPISDVWTHVNSVNACHMGNIAMLLKRKIVFDPDTYQFVGDNEANMLISRRQRSPWQITV